MLVATCTYHIAHTGHYLSVSSPSNELRFSSADIGPMEQFLIENHAGKVSFKSVQTQQYICADKMQHYKLVCDRKVADDWEKFDLGLASHATIALRSPIGKYVYAELMNNYPMILNNDTVSPWDILETHYDTYTGKTAFKTYHDKYISVEKNGTVVGDRSKVKDWELFSIEIYKDMAIALRSYHMTYWTVNQNNQLLATKISVGPMEKFTIEECKRVDDE